jgi:membrane protein
MATNEAPETSTATASTAPAPDDSRKPDSPSDVSKPAWKYITRKTMREFHVGQCPDLAAGLTY